METIINKDIPNKYTVSGMGYDFKGYSYNLGMLDILNEAVSSFLAGKIPVYQKDKSQYKWQTYFIDAGMKSIAKETIMSAIIYFIPNEWKSNKWVIELSKWKYIYEAIINVITGVAAKYGLSYLELSMSPISEWKAEIVDEIKTEVFKQFINLGIDMSMGK